MLKTSRIVAAAAAASMLAACSGNMSSIPASNNAPAAPSAAMRVPINSPFVMYDGQGHIAHIMLTRERMHELSLRPHANTPLTYHGGAVQTAPKVVLIFWGMSASDPEATILNHFFGNVGGSKWQNVDAQYSNTGAFCGTSGGSNCVGNGTGQLLAAVTDTSSVPKRPSQSAVAAIATKWAATYGTGPNINYFVAIAHGHDPSGFRTSWCAFHSATGSSSTSVSYTDFPYQTDAGTSCGQGYVNSPGTYDGVTIVGGHEYAEAQTDPQPSSGWVDSSGAEIGDKCAWTAGNPPGSQNVSIGSYTFPVQPLYSDEAAPPNGACAISY